MTKQFQALNTVQNKDKRIVKFLLILGILLFASNLRAPLTAVGAVVSMIRDSLEVSNTVVGVITMLPLLAFSLVSPFSPKVAKRFGMKWTIFLSMILLAIGMIIRSITGVATLFIGTALIGIAIAFGNVLLPGFIKMSFPYKIGVMTGLYAVSMNIFGALAAGLSVPLSTIGPLGWQGALGAWIILVIIAIIIWLPQLHKSPLPYKIKDNDKTKKTNMWTSATAWQVTLFMGLQSLMFYTMLTWLPEILLLNGYSSFEAGWMLSLMQFALIPLTFIVPIIADKLENQKLLGAITGLIFSLGITGLIIGHPILIVVSVILIGIGCGCAFSLSMMFFSLRTKDGHDASELSGMAQSFGYLLAAFGPVLFGGLYDFTKNWTASLCLLLILAIVILIVGWLSGRSILIGGK